jgi:hypothetical protein
MKFDIETLLDKLDAFFKSNLNTKIASINTEKGDYPLETLNQNSFLLWSMETENKSYNPFMLIQIADVTSSIAGNVVAENYSIEVLMFLQDDYNSVNNWRKVLRYWRAIKEVAADAWDRVAPGMQADIESLAPVSFRESETSNPMRVFGVQISFTIT